MAYHRITFTKSIFTPTLMALMVVMSIGAWGQTGMEQAFSSMPDSIIPYLTKNNRLDCIDFIKNNMKAEVENKFGSKSVVTVMTDNYLKMQLNQITDVEMKIFQVNGKDSILCMAKTVKTPEPDTELRFFNLNWEEMDSIALPQSIVSLTLTSEPVLYEARLSMDDETITVMPHRFFTNDKELNVEKAEETNQATITYKWNGKTLEQELY